MKDAPAFFGCRLYSVEKISLRLRVPNSCEQYVEVYKAGVHDALEQPILSPVRQRRRFVRPVVNSHASHISIHLP
jgi:hypothetical protein